MKFLIDEQRLNTGFVCFLKFEFPVAEGANAVATVTEGLDPTPSVFSPALERNRVPTLMKIRTLTHSIKMSFKK